MSKDAIIKLERLPLNINEPMSLEKYEESEQMSTYNETNKLS